MTGRLVVIEGIDGAGKRTLTEKLTQELTWRGKTVTQMAFPRYGLSIHATLVGDALRGKLGDLPDSVYAMAVLFALDRRDATEELRALLNEHDVVLLDRYIASNAAYGTARLREEPGGQFTRWVIGLEVARFNIPAPDLQILLRVPPGIAAARAAHRELVTDQPRDSYETDTDLQTRCAAAYDTLAAASWLSPWIVLDHSEHTSGSGAESQINDLIPFVLNGQ